jgi:beta-galactosidase
MAKRFGTNPNVIGWQIDNEYNRICYCEQCASLFQMYLAQRYKTLEQLNLRWTTAYWSQTYNSWDQIPLSIGAHNPGLMLEFKHFISHSYKQYQRLQMDELRPHLPQGTWITHNFMGWFEGFDRYVVSEDLDIAA